MKPIGADGRDQPQETRVTRPVASSKVKFTRFSRKSIVAAQVEHSTRKMRPAGAAGMSDRWRPT
jgi:hypothetical protein